jgi:hypothetical protein
MPNFGEFSPVDFNGDRDSDLMGKESMRAWDSVSKAAIAGCLSLLASLLVLQMPKSESRRRRIALLLLLHSTRKLQPIC